MAVLEVITYPDERLRKKAEPVEKVDDEVARLMDDMAETMYAAPGIGLAANQVGVLWRVVVVDVEYNDDKPNLVALVNPEIVSTDGKIVWEEGCLSLPGVVEEIERFERVVVKGLDREGKPVEIQAEGLLSVALQHEIDHLDGKVLLDRMSFLKRRMHHRELVKKKKGE